MKLASSYDADLKKAADHVRHLVKNKGKTYPVAISIAASEFNVDQGDLSRVLNPPKKAIKWTKPNVVEELDEYTQNASTKNFLFKKGYNFEKPEDLKKFLLGGKMEIVLPHKISSMQNLTVDPKEFQKEIEDSEYGSSYKSMRDELQKEKKINLPSPIAFKSENQYYLFSGNRRVNLAIANELPVKFWVIEIEDKNPKQKSLFSSKPSVNALYHGTDKESAEDIVKNGVNMARSHKGYFGKGFYLATDEGLAKSNYADFADEEGEDGVVLKFKLNPTAEILDLDKPEDFEQYKNLKWRGVPVESLRHKDDFDSIMRDLGIDGIRDEGSFGGIVIYNPKVLKLERQ